MRMEIAMTLPTGEEPSAGPLQGTRVLDLTRLMPGNYSTWVLASFGADVIKVEDPGAGDYMRSFGVQVNGQGALHHLVNRAKRSIVIDLKAAEGREAFLRLVDTADVVVESFRPGVLDRLGVGFDVLRRRRPRLVYANLSGYGPTGPLAHRAAHDLNYVAFSGLLHHLGTPASAPPVPPVAVADLIGGGLNTALAVMALLLRAQRTGVGGRADTALAEGAALVPSNLVADLLGGLPEPDQGTAEYAGAVPVYSVYALRDGYVTVGAVEPQFWRAVCDLLGEPELVEHRADAEFVRERLTARFATLTRTEARELFAGDDTCVEVVQTYTEAFASPHAKELGYLQDVPGLDMPVTAAPYLIDGVRPAETVPAPVQGQHTREVMAELGYTDADLDDLQRREVLAPRRTAG